jgi:sugar/nucleoside kinase (ribokinase family)
MTPDRLACDLAFIGHMCFDEVLRFGRLPTVAPGSAVLCGALAAARAGANVAVVTRMATVDEEIVRPMRLAGILVHLIPADVTTVMRVVQVSADVDDRRMYQLSNAGPFAASDIPGLQARQVHLAGITDQEFDVDLVRALKDRDYRVSADMQSFVRQVDPVTGEISFGEVVDKEALVGLLDMVKLDVVEARVLTGTDDLERAAITIEAWGSPETMITRSDGVLLRVNGRTHWRPFSNRSVVGRTGRGDTAFAAYMARRLDHAPDEALGFAAALVSLKMEKAGPFSGTMADVLERLHAVDVTP